MVESHRHLVAAVVALVFAACGGSQSPGDASSSDDPRPIAEFERMPSGVAVFGDRVFLAFPRWVEPGDGTVFELVEGELRPYPSAAANAPDAGPDALRSVNGIHVDTRGWLWILDNARVDLAPPEPGAAKLVVWDTVAEREVFRHVFGDDVAPVGASFLNDVVVDEANGFAYITQSGMGGPPGLVVLEIHRGIATAELVGDRSVSADPARDIVIDGEVVLLHRPTGVAPWRAAANSIALAPDGDTLLYGPMSSDTLFYVPTRALRDRRIAPEDRAAAVGEYGSKPISDGICASPDGRVFATDVERSAVVELVDGGTRLVASDERFSFPVAVEAPGDGTLWFTTNQLHRSPLVLGGTDLRSPPYALWRVPLPDPN